MGEWRATNIGGVTSLVTKGTTPPNGKGFVNVGVNYIKSDSLNYDGRIDTSLFVAIDPETHNTFKRSQIKAGDILFSMAGAFLGKSGIATASMLPANTNQAVAIIRPDPNTIDSTFLGLFFRQKSIIDFVNNLSGQSAQPNINFEEIKSIELMLPELSEQRAIASVLSSLDAKIDLLHRQNKTLEGMAEALFREWFVDRERLSLGEGDGKEEGWEQMKINDLVEIQSGFPFKSDTFNDSGPYQVITIKAVQDGYLELGSASRVTMLPARMKTYCHLQVGDILLSLTGNVGRCCMVDSKGLVLNQRVAKLHPRKSENSSYVYFLFRQSDFRILLEETAKGTAQANLSPIETGRITTLLPPEHLLQQFSKITTPMLDRILLNKLSIRRVHQLRDTLLPKLMSGEVRVEIPSSL